MTLEADIKALGDDELKLKGIIDHLDTIIERQEQLLNADVRKEIKDINLHYAFLRNQAGVIDGLKIARAEMVAHARSKRKKFSNGDLDITNPNN